MQSKHGGKRAGSGRKPKFGLEMAHKSVRLPAAWVDRLVQEFGAFQKAIDELVSRHFQ